jgi:catechol 2,3-dioxygenase-like lactoylglutathione lyase family enzyme
MAVKIIELHHHGIRIGPSPEEAEQALQFYGDVLGLHDDVGRPQLPVGGFWMDVGRTGQIHLMAVTGQSIVAAGPDKDPTVPHVALAVADVEEARAELDRLGVEYWAAQPPNGTATLFLKDPFGNTIELHQIDTCRCTPVQRAAADGETA